MDVDISRWKTKIDRHTRDSLGGKAPSLVHGGNPRTPDARGQSPLAWARRLWSRSSVGERWFGSMNDGRARTHHYAISYRPLARKAVKPYLSASALIRGNTFSPSLFEKAVKPYLSASALIRGNTFPRSLFEKRSNLVCVRGLCPLTTLGRALSTSRFRPAPSLLRTRSGRVGTPFPPSLVRGLARSPSGLPAGGGRPNM